MTYLSEDAVSDGASFPKASYYCRTKDIAAQPRRILSTLRLWAWHELQARVTRSFRRGVSGQVCNDGVDLSDTSLKFVFNSVDKLVFVSGKFYYDLVKKREKLQAHNIALVRLEVRL